MIATLLLLAAQPSVAEPPPENDIVVIGQRVRKVKFTVKADKAGRVACKIRRSSGDREIDSLACEAARGCMEAPKVSKEAMLACLTPRWKEIPVQIAARRRIRTEGSGSAPN